MLLSAGSVSADGSAVQAVPGLGSEPFHAGDQLPAEHGHHGQPVRPVRTSDGRFPGSESCMAHDLRFSPVPVLQYVRLRRAAHDGLLHRRHAVLQPVYAKEETRIRPRLRLSARHGGGAQAQCDGGRHCAVHLFDPLHAQQPGLYAAILLRALRRAVPPASRCRNQIL